MVSDPNQTRTGYHAAPGGARYWRESPREVTRHLEDDFDAMGGPIIGERDAEIALQ